MLASEALSRISVLTWAATWLPGLALFAFRFTKLFRAQKFLRSSLEGVALLALPIASFGAYVLSDAQLQRQAGRNPASLGIALSVAQVAVPYLACAVYLVAVSRGGQGKAPWQAWWVGAVVGLLSVPMLTPGLFMAQLMVIFGGAG